MKTHIIKRNSTQYRSWNFLAKLYSYDVEIPSTRCGFVSHHIWLGFLTIVIASLLPLILGSIILTSFGYSGLVVLSALPCWVVLISEMIFAILIVIFLAIIIVSITIVVFGGIIYSINLIMDSLNVKCTPIKLKD